MSAPAWLAVASLGMAGILCCTPQAPVRSTCSTGPDCQAELAAAKVQADQCNGSADCTGAYAQRDDIVQRLVVLRSQQEAQAGAEADREGKVNALLLEELERSRAAEQARVKASSEWRSGVMQTCADAWSTAGCDGAPAGAVPADQSLCRTFCTTQIDRRKEFAFHQAVGQCVVALKEQHGHGAPSCTFDAPDQAQPDLQARGEDCATQCRTRALGELTMDAQARAAEQSPPAARASRHKATPGTGMLMCNDGTDSPSCTCGRASNRGCCSHHGGVAGCDDGS